MDYRNYKIVNSSELDYIEKGVNAALNKWRSMWCKDDSLDISLIVLAMQDFGEILNDCGSKWLVGDIQGDRSIGLHWSSSFPDMIYKTFSNVKTAYINNTGIESLISKKLLNRSMTSLLEVVIDEFIHMTPEISASDKGTKDFLSEISQPGAGYVLLTINFDKSAYLVIAIDANSIIEEATANKTNDVQLSPAINAFGDNKVELQVRLGSAELDIKSMTGLSVGDVITIDKALNEKFSILIDDKEICDGYIGENDGHLSIKIDKTALN